ncbi:hypothetical protein [Anaerobiospirillum sp. NML120449]|uniref:hypothetical protein n=1 Tax=Anaerobiospirillum sp. NML120449 TaxID=2932817 RepID=UPI001FF265AA|nr:hypothetical protein [Anaerobiospirillum sp. NML120449]MCK0525403.1 hypothetical protein [Anaerobiospirillum sp. NML120449]
MSRVMTKESINQKIVALKEKEARFRARADEIAKQIVQLNNKLNDVDAKRIYDALKNSDKSVEEVLNFMGVPLDYDSEFNEDAEGEEGDNEHE